MKAVFTGISRRAFGGALVAFIVLLSQPAIAVGFLEEFESVDRLCLLIDQRVALMPDVAAWKWAHHVAISDPKRELRVIERALEVSATLGLSEKDVRLLFEKQIGLANLIQEELHAQWRRTGFDATRPIPSLETDLRPKLDRLTAQMLQSLYLAAGALNRADFSAMHGVLAKQQWRSPGWTEKARDEILDALSRVRRIHAPTLTRIRASGALRIGTTGDYEPFSLYSDGQLSGTDIDLARALAKSLSVEPIFYRTSWPTLLEDFRQDKFDVAISGISITPARQALAAFSTPYYSGGKTILSRRVDADRFASLAAVDRPGVRVIVNPGGTNEQYVREHLHHATIRVFPDNRLIFEEIRAGRADVMITDDREADWQAQKHSDLCRAMKGTLTQADKALMLPRETELIATVNEFLARLP